jgi:hypothetical protein
MQFNMVAAHGRLGSKPTMQRRALVSALRPVVNLRHGIVTRMGENRFAGSGERSELEPGAAQAAGAQKEKWRIA